MKIPSLFIGESVMVNDPMVRGAKKAERSDVFERRGRAFRRAVARIGVAKQAIKRALAV